MTKIKDIRRCDVCGEQFDEIENVGYGINKRKIHIDEAYPDPPWSLDIEDLCPDCWNWFTSILLDKIEYIKKVKEE